MEALELGGPYDGWSDPSTFLPSYGLPPVSYEHFCTFHVFFVASFLMVRSGLDGSYLTVVSANLAVDPYLLSDY
jgi:hypothetical protein